MTAQRGYNDGLRITLSDLPCAVDQAIEPSWPLDVAAQVLVLRQLRALNEYRELALLGENVAGVHKLRVACHRLAVIFAIFPELWPRKQLKPLRKALARLARSVGDARELDVEIIGLCERIDRVHDEEERALRWLWNRSVSARNREQPALVAALGQFAAEGWLDRLVQFFSTTPVELGDWLAPNDAGDAVDAAPDEEQPVSGDAASAPAGPNVGEALPGLIQAEIENVWQLAGGPVDVSLREAQHELRLAVKSLRYSIEFFATCLAAKPRRLTRPLRRCQKLLGDLHDGERQALRLVELLSAHGKALRRVMRGAVDSEGETDALAEIAHRAARTCHDLPAEGLALSLCALAERRTVLQDELAELWRSFAEEGYREQLESCCR